MRSGHFMRRILRIGAWVTRGGERMESDIDIMVTCAGGVCCIVR